MWNSTIYSIGIRPAKRKNCLSIAAEVRYRFYAFSMQITLLEKRNIQITTIISIQE